jgi:uncharacterized protein (TIGR02246 family)
MDANQNKLATEPDAAVRDVVSEFATTWNRHDMDAMHELCTADVEWINIVGMHWRGRPAVHKGHDSLHRTTFASTDITIEDLKVRALAAGVVCAVATMTFGPHVDPTGREIVDLETMGSFVLVGDADAWKIAHFHNTVIDQVARPFDPVNGSLAPG